jgi:hypothetical protein
LLPELRFSGLRGQPVVILDSVVGGVELWEFLHLTDQIDGVELLLAGPHFAMNKSTETLGNVANPAGFAVLAVADHIDSGLRLLMHDVGHFLTQELGEGSVIVWKTLFPHRHDLADGGRSHKAANMGDKNTIRASFHVSSPPFVSLIWSIPDRLINS